MLRTERKYLEQYFLFFSAVSKYTELIAKIVSFMPLLRLQGTLTKINFSAVMN